ncbi:PadR family transcriptional regulator [Actinorhabdospora filicis]|uniref:PadR family transcriptional regulator n=1 Tax=Actinorhabdospora filicis TaxID=1785913 RepID=A0A9W6WAQ8_9ACTN|nr:PadR family transcriptional regulator [Actinorhabdospora filicis]GLZ77900.1 PadR family transcriptional regulator [Actinorhabdospora filicis]
MPQRRKVGNLIALGVLALLVPGEPLHPYRIATLLKRTGKEHDMRIKWGSFYTVVANLEKHGFIEAVEAGREGRRPERTAYTITAAGRAELRDWLAELVRTPRPDAGPFESALSVLGVLPPDEVVALLEERLANLDAEITATRLTLGAGEDVPRVFLIEVEYALAMREAEAAWVRHLLGELGEGTMSGLAEWREWHEHGGRPASWDALLDAEKEEAADEG